MAARPALLVILATVVALHLAFYTGTYHVSEVKFFLFIAAVAALGAALAWERRAEPVAASFAGKLPRHVFAAVAAYVLVAAVSVLWAAYRLAAVFRTLEIALYAGWMLLVVLALRSRRDVSRAIDAFLAAGVLSVAAAFLLWPLVPEHAVQFFLPMGNPNWLAVAVLVPMMLCVEGFCRNLAYVAHPPPGVSSSEVKRQSHPGAGVPHKLQAALFAAAFLLMGATVFMADSQSSAVAFAVALAALPVLAGVRRKWLIAAAVAGALVLACAGDLALGKHSRLRAFGESKSVRIRLDMWQWGLTLAARNPVSGLGAGGFFPNVGEVAAPALDAHPGYYADIEVHAHNELLEVLVELGVFGLAAFLWPVGVCLWGVARLPRSDLSRGLGAGTGDHLRTRLAAFAAGWLAVLLQSLLDVGMRFESVPFAWWTGLAVLVAGLRLLPEKPGATDLSPGLGANRAAGIATGAIAALLAAAAIVTGLRGSIAMKGALDATEPAARLELRRTAAADEIFFIDRVRARNALGRELEAMGSPRAASDEYRAVLAMAGFYHDTELLLARTLLAQDRVEEAMAAIAHYGDLRPADPRSARLLVDWLRKQPSDEAVARVNALANQHPKCSKLYIAAGQLALQFAPPDEASARANFERALRANPADPQAAYLVGMDALNRSRFTEGRERLEAAWRGGFRSVECVINLAHVRQAVGDGRGARAALVEGAALFPDSDRIRKELDAVKGGG